MVGPAGSRRTPDPAREDRVLLLLPTAADARITRDLLGEAGIASTACPDIAVLCRELALGAGALLLAEERLAQGGAEALGAVLASQPAWSEPPILLLAARASTVLPLGMLPNLLVLDRPVAMRTLRTAVETALRARRRQYDVRDYLEDQARSAAAVAESEARFKTLAAATFEGIAITQDGTLLDVNDQLLHLLGCRRDEVIGTDIAAYLPVEDRDRVLRNVQEGRESLIEHALVRKDGTRIEVEAHGKTVQDGTRLVRYTAIRDVTDRKRAAAALQRTTTRYALLSETAGALLASSQPLDLVQELCGKVMAHLGCDIFVTYLTDAPSGRLRLHAWGGIPADEVQRIQWLEDGVALGGWDARDGQGVVAEDIHHTPESRTDHVRQYGIQAYCAQRLIAGGRLIGTLGFGSRTRPRFTADEVGLMRAVADQVAVAVDRVRAEEALRRQTSELEALTRTLDQRVHERTAQLEGQAAQLRHLSGELAVAEQRERQRLAEVLHDGLQQLLVGARLQMELLARGNPVHVAANSETVVGLLNEAIAASRSLTADLSPPVLHQAGLLPALQWLARWMQETHHLTVDLAADAGAEPAQAAVKLLLFHAVRELLFNAVKHAGVSQAAVEVRHRDGSIQITVADQGAGFDPARMHNRGATGLGLASVRQRIEYLGGTVTIQSAPGSGSRFTITVPVQGVPQERRLPVVAPDAPRDGALAGRPLRLLLADDHALMRQSLARVLNEEPDLEVVGEAADGQQAVELTAQLRPDLVLMDVSMPVMNGIDATQAIRAASPHIQVIGLSMFEEPSQAQAMREAGAAQYVSKTSATEALVAVIRSCAGRDRVD